MFALWFFVTTLLARVPSRAERTQGRRAVEDVPDVVESWSGTTVLMYEVEKMWNCSTEYSVLGTWYVVRGTWYSV